MLYLSTVVDRATLRAAFIAGVALGIAELTKFTWVFLFGLWPAVWLCVWPRQCKAVGTLMSSVGQLLLMIITSLWVINNGYLFEGSFQPVGRFEFFSETLSGQQLTIPLKGSGNRFRDTVLSNIPVPVPRNFVQGIDRVNVVLFARAVVTQLDLVRAAQVGKLSGLSIDGDRAVFRRDENFSIGITITDDQRRTV